jgi:hypothetical protein
VSFGSAFSRTNLHDISFRIPHGSFAAFVGSSGAGKSTLINLVMALDYAQRLRGQGVCILAPCCATAGRATEPACVAPSHDYEAPQGASQRKSNLERCFYVDSRPDDRDGSSLLISSA